ncbi:hypothetical protein A5656_18950 [Mycobacterium gordonae]|jgi:4-hydroxybenzoate polyprenyltransferase|nr:UbiA family prenyltransferase [Mycobacterium gordonae]OBK56656.1 hypothetical protein A5656_18950 [Mycobacterium gordonae]
MTVFERTGGIRQYLVERYLPIYPIYLTLWVVAVESMTSVVTDSAGPWRPTWDTLLRVLAMISGGAFLRIVDDQKDLEYDRVHNPTRPLVQGRITPAELRVAMVLTAALALLLGLAVSLPSAGVLAAALCYGLALWWTELHVAWVRDNPIVNLAMVCPAQFLATGFVMVGQSGVGGASGARLLAVPVVFTSAFLHLEFARKTSRADAGDPHSYSQLIGESASATIAWALGMLAVLLQMAVTTPWRWAEHWWPLAWAPLAAGILPCVSALIFFRGKADKHPQDWPTVFVVVFCLAIVGQGLVHH